MHSHIAAFFGGLGILLIGWVICYIAPKKWRSDNKHEDYKALIRLYILCCPIFAAGLLLILDSIAG